jgi:hypothetical protein
MLAQLDMFMRKPLLDFLPSLKMEVTAFRQKCMFWPRDYSDPLLKPWLDKVDQCFHAWGRLFEIKMRDLSHPTFKNCLGFVLSQQPLFRFMNDESNDFNLFYAEYQKQLENNVQDPACSSVSLQTVLNMHGQAEVHDLTLHYYSFS